VGKEERLDLWRGNLVGEHSLGTPRRTWKDNIKMDLVRTRSDGDSDSCHMAGFDISGVGASDSATMALVFRPPYKIVIATVQFESKLDLELILRG